MVEPCDFSEIYLDAANIKDSFKAIEGLTNQEIYINRFTVDRVKKLSKYLDALKQVKENIDKDLENIQTCFDNLETFTIVYIHNLEKVQNELIRLSEERQKEIEQLPKNKKTEIYQKEYDKINELMEIIEKTEVKECIFD